MKIASVQAWPASFPVPENERVSLGIGTAVKPVPAYAGGVALG